MMSTTTNSTAPTSTDTDTDGEGGGSSPLALPDDVATGPPTTTTTDQQPHPLPSSSPAAAHHYSHNNGGTSLVVPSVTPDRKRSLLLEARRDRVAWVDASSIPFDPGFQSRTNAATAASEPLLRNGTSETTVATGGDGTTMLRSARACVSLPSAVEAVRSLYGGDRGKGTAGDGGGGMSGGEMEERIRRQLESQVSTDDVPKAIVPNPSPAHFPPALPSPRRFSSSGGAGDDASGAEAFLESYRNFLHKLRSPECADLVQGMRHFVHSLEDMAAEIVASRPPSSGTTKAKSERGDDDDEDDERDEEIKRLASAMHTYLDTTYDTIQSHPCWKSKDGVEPTKKVDHGHDLKRTDVTHRSLEAFVHSKCHQPIWSALLDDVAIRDDEEMAERISSLQFVSPAHLEIRCLMNDKRSSKPERDGSTDDVNEEADGSNEEPCDDIRAIGLDHPIQSLVAIDHQFSPSEKLRYVLDMYRGINAALHTSMQQGDDDETKAAPGADDVLPTVILTVLRAKPQRLTSNLRFIELFATEEDLRGEAGYAYTNLYGAVQFLKDLDLGSSGDDKAVGEEEDGGGKTGGGNGGASLSISPEDFRKGLERCRAEAAENVQRARKKSVVGSGATMTTGDGNGADALPKLPKSNDVPIPVSEIRAARLRGEDVGLDWALRWQEEHSRNNGRYPGLSSGGDRTAPGEGTGQIEDAYLLDHESSSSSSTPYPPPPLPLPQGFARSYTFLSTDPDDVRVSDLPQLLHEYRMLVHATEALIAERTARYNAEHKRKVRRARERLEYDAAEADAAMNDSNGGKS